MTDLRNHDREIGYGCSVGAISDVVRTLVQVSTTFLPESFLLCRYLRLISVFDIVMIIIYVTWTFSHGLIPPRCTMLYYC